MGSVYLLFMEMVSSAEVVSLPDAEALTAELLSKEPSGSWLQK